MSFSNLRIPVKLAAAFGAVILTICTMVGFVFMRSNEAQEARASSERIDRVLEQVEAASYAMLEQQNAIRGILISQEPRFLERYEAAKQQFKSKIELAGGAVKSAEAKALFARVMAAATEWQQQAGDVQAKAATDPNALPKALEIFRDGTRTRILTAYRRAQESLTKF